MNPLYLSQVTVPFLDVAWGKWSKWNYCNISNQGDRGPYEKFSMKVGHFGYHPSQNTAP